MVDVIISNLEYLSAYGLYRYASYLDDNSLKSNQYWLTFWNKIVLLWSDGGAKNLAGQLAIEGNKMIAYIPAKKITLYFQFYREPGQFVVRDRKSRTYNFKRIH
ncbi:hypothetical protein [sulfur-oxidizing endosymbiont of Gigantopelta aegis]|uniref:hypothetical protein n=1 Tax=sulfur-oxidizing endosymbiont of Gigantopelta aegis TaxID=2794934 RepID=UPI0018DB2831|nr:hypothetical protein [sulfur-oxidizing endosymbiont of Gigantopelta aegis]